MKPCPSLSLVVTGLTILPWFVKEQSLFLWVMELPYCAFEAKIQSQRDEGFVTESILKHKSLEGKAEVKVGWEPLSQWSSVENLVNGGKQRAPGGRDTAKWVECSTSRHRVMPSSEETKPGGRLEASCAGDQRAGFCCKGVHFSSLDCSSSPVFCLTTGIWGGRTFMPRLTVSK